MKIRHNSQINLILGEIKGIASVIDNARAISALEDIRSRLQILFDDVTQEQVAITTKIKSLEHHELGGVTRPTAKTLNQSKQEKEVEEVMETAFTELKV